jgi:hypothetical protein
MDNADQRYIESINKAREKSFRDAENIILQKFARRVSPERRNNFNVCCNEDEKHMIQSFADKIRTIPEYSFVSLFDIYLTLIFTYYSLHLMEQTRDWLRTFDLEEALDSYTVNELYRDITIGDIIDDNGNNISSEIRRAFMGLRGGKRSKRKSNKRHKRKTNKRKSKRRI